MIVLVALGVAVVMFGGGYLGSLVLDKIAEMFDLY